MSIATVRLTKPLQALIDAACAFGAARKDWTDYVSGRGPCPNMDATRLAAEVLQEKARAFAQAERRRSKA